MAPPAYNPRSAPAYSIAEAARYLYVPRTTLAQWVRGRVRDGRRVSAVIAPAQLRPLTLLSFENLVEAFVLSSLRTVHEVSLPEVRRALKTVAHEFGTDRPLLTEQFYASGGRLFVEKYGALIDARKPQQLAMIMVMAAYIQRVERDERGLVRRIFPFVDMQPNNDPRVAIDPARGFGRPTIADTNIRTEIIAERFRAGEPVAELALDYEVRPDDIQQALRVERVETAA